MLVGKFLLVIVSSFSWLFSVVDIFLAVSFVICEFSVVDIFRVESHCKFLAFDSFSGKFAVCIFQLQAIAAMSNIKFSDVIKQYDGSGDFAEWVEKLEMVASLQGITEVENFLPLFLTGGAFNVYQGLTTPEKKKYDTVKAKLLTAFSSDPCHAYEEFQMRRLNSGEAVDVYLADLRRLALLVDGAKVASDQWLKCAFIAGLPTGVKAQLRAACSVNKMLLGECVERARILIKSEDVCMLAANNSVVETKGAGKPTTCYGCGEEGHMKRNCPSLFKAGGVSHSRTCYRCGKEGHMSRDCLAPAPRRVGQNKCFVCGDVAHMAPACPKRFGAASSKNE